MPYMSAANTQIAEIGREIVLKVPAINNKTTETGRPLIHPNKLELSGRIIFVKREFVKGDKCIWQKKQRS